MTHNDIPGFFDWREFYKAAFNQICESFPEPQTLQIVELGTFFGKSACFMGELIKDSHRDVHFETCDLFDTRFANDESISDFVKFNLQNNTDNSWRGLVGRYLHEAGVLPHVTVTTADSVSLASSYADDSVHMVYIDACHEYDSVHADISAWLPKIKTGGIISGHDYDRKSVQRAVAELIGPVSVTCERTWFKVK